MPLREFEDRSGVPWKVWEITPDQLHPTTRQGDYMQGFLEGWLVFETLDGGEKRRLSPVPVGWESLSDGELVALCAKAESARGAARRAREEGSERAPAEGLASRGDRRLATRTFLYPGGRLWTVAEQIVHRRDRAGEPIGARAVLRFTSGSRSLDLEDWPSDWAGRSDEGLADLLAGAFPREESASASSPFRRRRSDQRA